jgi:hypothetical protein
LVEVLGGLQLKESFFVEIFGYICFCGYILFASVLDATASQLP